MISPQDSEPRALPATLPSGSALIPSLPEQPLPGVSSQVRLICRASGRWAFTADETTMRVICSMIRNSSVQGGTIPDPVTREVVRRVLRAIRLARVF